MQEYISIDVIVVKVITAAKSKYYIKIYVSWHYMINRDDDDK